MYLTVDQERIDYLAAVIDRDIAQESSLACVFVDLDNANVCAERKREILWLEKVSSG